MSSFALQMQLKATAVCAGATGAPVAGTNKGIASVADTGVGVHTFTLTEAIDVNQCFVTVQLNAAAIGAAVACSYFVEHTSDSVKVIRFQDSAGAAADPTQYAIMFFQNTPVL